MINAVYRLVAPGMLDVAYKEIDIKSNVIIRPEYLSICKADQRYYLGARDHDTLMAKLPMALIHECVGTVVYDPTGTYKRGEAVIPVPNVPTNDDEFIAENYLASSYFCSSGHDGFLRDYVDMPPDRLVRVPEGINHRIAAFTELVSVSVHATSRFLAFSHGRRDTIGVWGDGNLGFITALVLRYMLPEAKLCIFGTVSAKLAYFTFADEVYNVTAIPEGVRVDHAFECVGGEASGRAIAQIIERINPEGAISLMGVSENLIGINTRLVLEKGLRLFGSSRSGVKDFQKTVDLFVEHPELANYLENLIGEVIPIYSIADIHKAFSADVARNFGKTILDWRK